MSQSLLTVHGAQPEKPTKYKPIWTDRFFTGYFTNRSPFRSPLSTFYADGWHLGKTDVIIDGSNSELSPRLTMIRRPGMAYFNSVNQIPTAPLSFYSFHAADGTVHVVVDTAATVYLITPTTLTPILNKASNQQGPSTFYGIGTFIYITTKTTTFAYDVSNGVARSAGAIAPTLAPTFTFSSASGAGSTLHGVKLNGTTGYVSTPNAIPLGSSTSSNNCTAECWINTTNVTQTLMSFESSPTGTSTNVFRVIGIDGNGNITVAVYDAVANAMAVIQSTTKVNDGKWHFINVTMSYTCPGQIPVSSVQSVQVANYTTGQNRYGPDPLVGAQYIYNNVPSVSYAKTPAQLQVSVYVDGTEVINAQPSFGNTALENGFWRLGNSSTTSYFTGSWFNGIMSHAGVHNTALNGNQPGRFAAMMQGSISYYESIAPTFLTNGWFLQETSGTTATDSISTDSGTYLGGFTLFQGQTIPYVPYTASTGYSLGEIIVDPNGDYQLCTTAGTSGSTAPSWNKNEWGTTPDGTVVWTNQGQASLTFTSGAQYGYCYVNQYGHFSTMSPLSGTTGPQTGIKVTLTGPTSAQDHIKSVAIFRTVDGGSTPFYLGSVQNNGLTWVFTDATPDEELNILMAAPQADSNDPPPIGLTNLTYHMGRLWGSVGGVLYASGGPDTLVGDGDEAWPPANSWSFPAQINRLVSTSTGLFVCTTDGIQLLAGGPSIPQFYPQMLLARIGLLSYNALDYNGSRITLFTADRQLLSIDTSVGLVDLGFPIGDKLALLNPASVYVCEHHNGLDHAIYIGDGSTGWYRCSPQQPPDYQITGPVWSPKATINGGNCAAISSVETSPGTYQLLVGSSGVNGFISARDSGYTTFTDLGTGYDSFFTVGSVVLASPGELAEIAFITADFIRTGTSPAVSVLMDEISGTFSSISGFVVSDPYQIYGASGGPATLFSNRYYMRQAQLPAYCRHMQIKVDFGTDAVQNEILSMTIFGTLLAEGA